VLYICVAWSMCVSVCACVPKRTGHLFPKSEPCYSPGSKGGGACDITVTLPAAATRDGKSVKPQPVRPVSGIR